MCAPAAASTMLAASAGWRCILTTSWSTRRCRLWRNCAKRPLCPKPRLRWWIAPNAPTARWWGYACPMKSIFWQRFPSIRLAAWCLAILSLALCMWLSRGREWARLRVGCKSKKTGKSSKRCACWMSRSFVSMAMCRCLRSAFVSFWAGMCRSAGSASADGSLAWQRVCLPSMWSCGGDRWAVLAWAGWTFPKRSCAPRF